MKIKKTIYISTIVISLGLFKLSLADTTLRSVKMACSPFPPFKIENTETGEKGIDIDIMLEIFALSGRKVEYSFYPWKRAVKLVETGKADGLCGCSYHPDRENTFKYSDIVGQHSQGVFLADGVELEKFDSVSDLQGLSLATVRGYTIHKELAEAGVKTHKASGDDELLLMLENKRVDAIYTYRDIFLHNLSRSGKSTEVNYKELVSKAYYFCFSNVPADMDEIVDEVNKGLRTIRYNGTYDNIWKNYQ
ncbi:substrate-binding periplasmic protein [Kiloniella antarctica]|uniref:Substrate-binding periplasmic protein n=1 Tax=Kiloniella antarctica TaxID=1550907 RepID=A0ABW5BM56_9PROT